MKPLTGFLFVTCLVAVVAAGVFRHGSAVAGSTLTPITPTFVPALADGEVVPVEESMHEFMEYVFQPTYRRLKASMATAPADNAGWKAVKADSLSLAESCNLLLGRKPEEHAADWVKHAVASRTAGAALYNAAKTKDFTAATTSYKTMLESCNACHRQFEEGKHILQP